MIDLDIGHPRHGGMARSAIVSSRAVVRALAFRFRAVMAAYAGHGSTDLGMVHF